MRILQICPVTLRTAGGGFAEYVKNISIRLAKNHSVTVYGSNPGGRFPTCERIEGVKVERFRHISPNNSYYFSLHLAQKLLRSDFEVVHAHGYQTFPFHVSRLVNYKKLILSPHYHEGSESSLRNCLRNLFEPIGRKTLLSADHIICVSEYEKSVLCGKFRLDEAKLCVIPNGVDFSEFSNLNRCNKNFRSILYVGRLEKYKGIQYLLEVLPRLSNDIVLDVVGQGPYRQALENLAEKLGIQNRVQFHQNIKRKKLLQMFVDADVFVLLSMYEAYSLVIAEAFVAGTPCIVANATALSEWIDNKKCFGLDFPINLTDLAQLIEQLLGKRSKYQSNCDIQESKILDWNQVASALGRLYSD